MLRSIEKYDLAIETYNNDKSMNVTELISKFKLDKACFYRYMKKRNIKLEKRVRRNYNITKKYQELADIYNNSNISINELCKKNKISQKSFSKFLKNNKYVVRRTYEHNDYEYNRNFFEEINTENKAYWLGFIFADGCISYRSGVHKLTIEISNIDLNHLKKFNNDLNSNLKIFKRKNRNTSFVNVTSIKLTEDLIKLGAVVNKTVNGYFSNEILNLPDELKLAFCRGYFDGDGFIDKTRNRAIYTIKSKIITNHMKDFLSKYHFKIRKDKKYYRLYVENKVDFLSFLNDIYKNANIYLDRKYNIYLNRCAPPDTTAIEGQDEKRGNSKEA